MTVEMFLENIMANSFSKFKKETVLAIVKGCDPVTREVFFSDAASKDGVNSQWKKIAVRLVAYVISGSGTNAFSGLDGIKNMNYASDVGSLIANKKDLWTEVFDLYIKTVNGEVDDKFMEEFYRETTADNFIMGRDMQKEEGWETTQLCFALVREKLSARFEEYCRAWERILSHDKVAAWKAEDYFSEYAASDILKEGIRCSVENALGAVTNINEWFKEEKRTRYVAAAGHNVITVREKRMARHKEYDRGKAVADWLQASNGYLPQTPQTPDVHVDEVSYSGWETDTGGGGCVTGDTKIRLANGRDAEIAQIGEGWKILSRGGLVSVTSDEKIVNKNIKYLYGFNGRKPFMSLEHAVLTAQGWKSLAPESTNEINPYVNASLLREGDVIFTIDGEETVRSIEIEAAETESFTGYDLHFREGYHSYYANGILVLLNYPEVTVSRIKKSLEDMSEENQRRFRSMFVKNSDLLEQIFGRAAVEQIKEDVFI